MDLLMINLKDYHMMVNNILIILYINIMKYILFLFVLLFLLPCISGYTNYVSFQKPFRNHKINCPENYAITHERLLQRKRLIQPFGYTPNEYLEKTRFIESDIPLPVNADFF